MDEELRNIMSEADTTTKNERYYARKFTSLYNRTRKALVFLNKARKTVRTGGRREVQKNGKVKISKGEVVRPSKYTHEEAYNKACEVLSSVIEE